VTGGTCGTFNQTVNASNQFNSSPYQYDAAMTHDGSHIYYYDAENHLIQIDGTLGTCSTATACYVYDYAGRRVQRTLGGGTTGTWNGDSFSGHSELNPGAVAACANAASDRNEAPLVGLSTLTFHELGHETHFGEALTQQYPVTPTISSPREQGASSAGSRMSQAVGAPFDCSIPGGCQ